MIPEGYREIYAVDKGFSKKFLQFVGICHRSGARVAFKTEVHPMKPTYILIRWDGQIYDFDDAISAIVHDQQWLDKWEKGFIVAK